MRTIAADFSVAPEECFIVPLVAMDSPLILYLCGVSGEIRPRVLSQ